MNPQRTATGTQMMQEHFAIFRKAVADMSALLDGLQESLGKNDPKIRNLSDGIFCFELALKFYEEANLALQAGAWFAAASIASSALESVLLNKCFSQEAEIRALPKFQNLKRSYKADFGVFARSLDLGKLLEIADELSWFPNRGVPTTFTNYLAGHIDELTLAKLVEIFEGDPHIGKSCARYVRNHRNLLHPAVCLREGVQPSKDTGLVTTFFVMIAFLSISGAE